jgi:opacity protein-like surface antigen
MKQVLLATVVAAALATAAPSVAGRWTMAVDGGPHGNVTMGLTLSQDGSKVTGTFTSPHGDMNVAGEFVEGQLKIATTAGGDDEKIYFEARLNDDGTLSGSISSPMGDMKWKGTRVADKDGR